MFIAGAEEIYMPAATVECQIAAIRAQVGKLSQENSDVLQAADDLIAALRSAKQLEPLLDLNLILVALTYSAERHQHQTRKDEAHTPYIIHPMGVARQMIAIGGIYDTDMLAAALLHDVIEDTFSLAETDQGFAEIRTRFGERVEKYVREVTDDKSLPTPERKRLQIENAPHKSAGATAIKLSDKLYNLEDLLRAPPPDWTQERVDQYFQWAQKVVDALPAHHPALKDAVDLVIEAHSH